MHKRLENYLLLNELYKQGEEGEIDNIIIDIINNFSDYDAVEDLVTNKAFSTALLDDIYIAVTSADILAEKRVLELLQAGELPFIAYLTDVGRYVLKVVGADYLNSLPVTKQMLFIDIEKVVADYGLR